MVEHNVRTIITVIVEPNPIVGGKPVEVGVGKLTRLRADAEPTTRFFDPPRADLLGRNLDALSDIEIENL